MSKGLHYTMMALEGKKLKKIVERLFSTSKKFMSDFMVKKQYPTIFCNVMPKHE